ncbi:uncharacterized protein E0L32_008693 [Thyridium curvatum]|uniref:Mitochondrial outer membrane protein OM14 C-terminal domain-containing protein n=1 Tax=Thyridium curvatum TaxID=1093900 RepID=A0A507AZX0_9PEZI|nr:uncharacterized protein E0L32_008693 [Thyridium curvatum]TPX10288.1 hypothetical protein E0L32_008693 [Thyridium curvatum]
MAAKGPKQTPEEAAAPQPPQIEHEDDSTASLIDVDTQSVRTVPSDFMEQSVQTETQADRIAREEEARTRAREAKDKAAARARRADGWLTRQLAAMSDGAVSALAVANFAAVLGLGSFLGYKAWGLYERGRLGWRSVGLGVGILGAVGVVEGVFGSYINKSRSKKH